MGVFSRFLNCANTTKSRKASHILVTENSPKVFVKRPNMQEGKIGVEILAPSITLTIEKFIHYRPTDKGMTE